MTPAMAAGVTDRLWDMADLVAPIWHVHERDGKDEDLLIGVYGTEADAKAAIERLKSKADL
jgi:hypothetical protein